MRDRRLVPLVAALALALSACGGGGGGDTTSAAGGSTTNPPVASGSPGASGGTPVASSANSFGPVTLSSNTGPQAPAVARLAGGGSVVVWQTFNGPVLAQRVDANGQSTGLATQVTATAGSTNMQPAVVPLAAGGFAVLWADAVSTGSTTRVLLRLFDANGNATTPVTPVSTTVTSITEIDAAPLPNGGFVLAWAGTQLVGGPATVAVQRFDANGNAVAQAQLTTPASAAAQRHPQVAVQADGSFVVAWLQAGPSSALPSFTVTLQRFAADGTAVGTERTITETAGNATFPFDIAALANGRLALVWQSLSVTQASATLNLELLSGDGTAVAAPVQLASGVEVFDPHVAALGATGFVATWEKTSVASVTELDATVFSQRFGNDGTPLEQPQALGTHGLQTPTGQATGNSSLAAGTDGRFLLAYDRWLAGSFIDLLGR